MSYQAWKDEPFHWAPTKKLGGGWIAHKSAPDPAPAPDYTGAAKATAEGNLEAARLATEANRVNQVTPWGSLTWTKTTTQPTFDQAGYDAAMQAWQARRDAGYVDFGQQVDGDWGELARMGGNAAQAVMRGTTPMPTRDQFTSGGGEERWTQTTSLTPELQAALDAQMKVQQNQSSLAQQMQGRVADTMSQPLQTPDYASYMSGVPGVQTGIQPFNPSGAGSTNTDVAGATAGAGGVALNNRWLSSVPGITAFNAGSLQQAGGASAGNVSTDASGYLSGIPGINYDSRSYTNGAQPVSYDVPAFDEASLKKYADATYSASTRLLQDQWNQQNGNLDVQLRLQGLTPGTEAYNNAMQNSLKSQDFTKAQLADTALTTGAGIANQNYASMLAAYKARNEAQAQDFGQRLQNYSADLGAQNQGFTQGMSKANYAQTGQDMNARNGISAAAVNVQAAQANNQAALAAYNANLAAQGQAFTQADRNFQSQLAAQGQAYSQGLAGFEAGNAAQQQAYNQALAGFGADLSATQAANAAQQQAYSQAANDYGTAYQSALSNYTMPLNMMNAVLSGNQVSTPNFGGYYTQGQTAGADQLGAASALGSWNQGIYNSQVAQTNAANSSTASVVAAALPILFSDARLKKGIRRIGTTQGGYGWYEWNWIDGSGRGEGVIAQEVPHATVVHPSGYLMVDYSKIN